MAMLHGRFRPKALADEAQTDRFFIRWMARRVGALLIPDMAAAGALGREAIERALEVLGECLARGENVLLYPAGSLTRGRLEDIGGNSAVQRLLHTVPDAQVVLVRTRGLWGSSFSWASGRPPSVSRALRRGIRSLLVGGIFFAPRREVTIELHYQASGSAGDSRLKSDDRAIINRYLEDFFNEEAPHNTYVPYTIWEGGGTRRAPEPEMREVRGKIEDVPATTREIVTSYLRDLAGATRIGDADQLGRDLGLDSLARSDLLVFLTREFGFSQSNVDSLRTVKDVLLAASGEPTTFDASRVELNAVPAKWFPAPSEGKDRHPISMPDGPGGGPPRTVTEAFLAQVRLGPDRAVIADQSGGVRTYRDVVRAIFVLRPLIEKLRGERVGIMLPASATADIVYLATLFAGKTPVMVNWTVGVRNMSSSLEATEVEAVLTARALVTRVESLGTEFGELADRFVYLEDIAAGVSGWTKLRAALKERFGRSSLADAKVPETAVILFTSGSETLPKPVPLTHANLLTNLRDAIGAFGLWGTDRLLGFLPPFHSFGLTVGTLVPLCLGVPTVYHPSPNESGVLGRLVEAYRVTMLVGTPTFLNGIVTASRAEQLASLRLGVTGAEKCPPRVYAALRERCPKMVVIEGYGVTECSPVIAVNDEAAPREGTIGRVLPSFDYVIVGPETHRRVEKGSPGVLLVRGPCVFGGYIAREPNAPPSPFVEFEDKSWYGTGDLVTEDDDGVLTFRGRLKRFVKLGGEMISLPAIEAVLEPHYPPEEGGGPAIAVHPFFPDPSEGRAELILFVGRTVRGEELSVDRETVNAQVREAGLSALHNIRRVIRIDEIPVLGTGKTDYRSLEVLMRKPEPLTE